MLTWVQGLIGAFTPRTYSAPAVVAVTISSGEAVAANAARTGLILTNDSNATIYLAIGATAVAGSGIRINSAGGQVQFGGPGGLPLTTDAINAIHGSTGDKNLAVQEVT